MADSPKVPQGVAYDPTFDPTTESLDPVLTGTTNSPSPAETRKAELTNDRGIRDRLAQADLQGPTVRQRTQSEIIDLSLYADRGRNPYSLRYVPFTQLREMTTDLMLAFGWWMTLNPIIRAEWSLQGPDAQLNAAVDEGLRPVIAAYLMAFSNVLWYGSQPIVKTFKLGRLGKTYRDGNSDDPDKDLPVWSSSADALLWKAPAALNPSHCIPTWDDDGEMVGFKFSNTPIPNFDLISAASAYGYMVIPGHEIDHNYGIWAVNEASLHFGSCFGSPRTSRAYPIWWSYWFRWRLADRSYENLADPAKFVYYPVDFDYVLDPDDPNLDNNPQLVAMQQKALDLGEGIRSGATVALPGSFAETMDGKGTSNRKWEVGYMKAPNNFKELEASFKELDVMKLRAWFTPEQSVISGTGGRTAGGSAGGTGGARMASALADVQEQSQQMLLEEWDALINDHMIPQFIAANFPEKLGTPCKKVSRALGMADDQTISQILTLIGQVRGEVLPVDMRALLEQLNVPLLSETAWKAEMNTIAKYAAEMQPPMQEPQAQGLQGYNAGVSQGRNGQNFYYAPPQRIVLAEHGDWMQSLPDTPHFKVPAVRSALLRLRRILKDRYTEQFKSFADFLEQQPTLRLAEPATQPNGNKLTKEQAEASAASIIAAWAGSQAPGAIGAPAMVTAEGFGQNFADLTSKIALAAGHSTLKNARLDAADFDANTVQPWIDDRVKFALDSIDNTVRQEAQDWLVDELQQTVDPDAVAKAAREHFMHEYDFPTSHAERTARTEACESFNRGCLEALDHAGVAQVQAHDASDGSDLKTDAPCLRRNSKIFTLSEAKNEHLQHPNCSLYFTPLTTEKLSVERAKELPLHLAEQGRHFAYDESTETLHLDEKIDLDTEATLLLSLGEQFALS